MTASLLPERPLLVFPSLAATIGLEEAVMLQGLADCIAQGEPLQRAANPRLAWIRLDGNRLGQLFPFWQEVDVRRIQQRLQTLGMVVIDPGADDAYYLAINEDSQQQSAPVAAAVAGNQPAPGHAALIPGSWQPDRHWLRMCSQQGIPEEFALGLVPEFVSYWRERGQARFSWGNAFYKHVMKQWRGEQARQGARELASTMNADWQPSEDAIGILVNAGISAEFIEDAVPEFVLYWRERGAVHGAWNSRFIEHIRRQWAKFCSSFGRDDTPGPIPEDWQPSAECYEILQLAEIDEDYARSRVPEFVMYWKDSQQAKASWNTVFLQYIKQDWAWRLQQLATEGLIHAEDQSAAGANQQRVKERFQRIADRSWAD